MSLSSSASSEETYSMNDVYDTNEFYDLPTSDMLDLSNNSWVYLTEADGTPAVHHEYLDLIYTPDDNDMLLNFDPTTLYFNPYELPKLPGSKYECNEQLTPAEDEIAEFMDRLNQLDDPFYFDQRMINLFIEHTNSALGNNNNNNYQFNQANNQELDVMNVLAPPSQPDTSVASTESEPSMYDVTPDISPYCNMSL